MRSRIVLFVLLIVAGVGAVVITMNNWGSKPQSAGSPSAPITSIQGQPSGGASQLSNPPPSSSGDTGLSSVVNAAAMEMNEISVAQFLPSGQRSALLRRLATPESAALLLKAYPITEGQLVKAWGYATPQDAEVQANYYVSTKMYHLDTVGHRRATIRLYTISHWVTSTGSEYFVPSVTIVTLQKHGDQWRYVKAERPPKNEVPTPQLNLSLQQTERRFQPYLRGYTDYEGPQTG